MARFAFDIPDEWMAAAGMRGFVPRRKEYRARPHGNADLATIILLVDDIGVARRGAGVPDLDRDRMVSVLSAFRLDQALPPVEVIEDGGERPTHRLYHGRHRVAASIAVRFPLIPAVIVRDRQRSSEALGECEPAIGGDVSRCVFDLVAVHVWLCARAGNLPAERPSPNHGR